MKLCDLKTAKALQELGYDGEYHKGYTNIGELTDAWTWTKYPAPRLDDAAYWIREKYDCYISILPIGNSDYWYFMIYKLKYSMCELLPTEAHDSYDSTLEAAVSKVIEIIKKKKQ